MAPNYVVKKSIVATLNPLLLLLFWLIVPLIIQIVKIIVASHHVIEFYDERMVIKSGVINKQETQSVFMGVYSVNISQTLFGRMFDYGDVSVDCPGKWDLDTNGIKNPRDLKKYLETKITSEGVNKFVNN